MRAEKKAALCLTCRRMAAHIAGEKDCWKGYGAFWLKENCRFYEEGGEHAEEKSEGHVPGLVRGAAHSCDS